MRKGKRCVCAFILLIRFAVQIFSVCDCLCISVKNICKDCRFYYEFKRIVYLLQNVTVVVPLVSLMKSSVFRHWLETCFSVIHGLDIRRYRPIRDNKRVTQFISQISDCTANSMNASEFGQLLKVHLSRSERWSFITNFSFPSSLPIACTLQNTFPASYVC